MIQYWSQYIQLHPNDGRAYCERGGAYSQLHDAPHTLADAEKACSLGDATCCQVVRKSDGRPSASAPPNVAPATAPPTWVRLWGPLTVFALLGVMMVLFYDSAIRRARQLKPAGGMSVLLAQASGWTLPPELAHLPPRTVQIKPLDAIGFFMAPAVMLLVPVVAIGVLFHFLPLFDVSELKNENVIRRVYIPMFALLIATVSFVFAGLATLHRRISLFSLAKDLMEMGTATRGVITYKHVPQRKGDFLPVTIQYQFTARENQVTNAAIKDFPTLFSGRMPVGGEITVLYDPSNFERSIPYPLCPFKVLGQS